MQSEQQQRIMGYFIEEAKDHLNTIEQGLLSLQSTMEDSEMLNEVFRAAHSIKGGAAMLGLNSIQHTAHRLEDCFKVLQESPVQPDSQLESLFLQVFDTLEALIEQLQGPYSLTDDVANSIMSEAEPVFEELYTHLKQLVNQAASATVVTAEAPDAIKIQALEEKTPLLTTSQFAQDKANFVPQIFKRDVLIELREMLQLFKQQDTSDHRQALQRHCDRLVQLDEQLDLPGWSELLETAKAAIAHLPNSYRQLAGLVIKEIKQAQELVLANRSVEITPSDQLKALVPTPLLSQESTDVDTQQPASALTEDINVRTESVDHAIEKANDNVATDGSSPTTHPTNHLAPDTQDQIWEELNPQEWAQDRLVTELDSSPTSIPTFEFQSAAMDFQFDTPKATAQLTDLSEPEVGMAELNSLADIFEGQTPDLDQTWQEEEIISLDNKPMVQNPGGSLSLDDHSDFSDLINDLDGLEMPSTEASTSDDLMGWFGDDTTPEGGLSSPESTDFFFEEPHLDETPLSTRDGAALESLRTSDFSDLIFEASSSEPLSTPSTDADDITSLFGDSFYEEESAFALPELLPQDDHLFAGPTAEELERSARNQDFLSEELTKDTKDGLVFEDSFALEQEGWGNDESRVEAVPLAESELNFDDLLEFSNHSIPAENTGYQELISDHEATDFDFDGFTLDESPADFLSENELNSPNPEALPLDWQDVDEDTLNAIADELEWDSADPATAAEMTEAGAESETIASWDLSTPLEETLQEEPFLDWDEPEVALTDTDFAGTNSTSTATDNVGLADLEELAELSGIASTSELNLDLDAPRSTTSLNLDEQRDGDMADWFGNEAAPAVEASQEAVSLDVSNDGLAQHSVDPDALTFDELDLDSLEAPEAIDFDALDDFFDTASEASTPSVSDRSHDVEDFSLFGTSLTSHDLDSTGVINSQAIAPQAEAEDLAALLDDETSDDLDFSDLTSVESEALNFEEDLFANDLSSQALDFGTEEAVTPQTAAPMFDWDEEALQTTSARTEDATQQISAPMFDWDEAEEAPQAVSNRAASSLEQTTTLPTPQLFDLDAFSGEETAQDRDALDSSQENVVEATLPDLESPDGETADLFLDWDGAGAQQSTENLDDLLGAETSEVTQTQDWDELLQVVESSNAPNVDTTALSEDWNFETEGDETTADLLLDWNTAESDSVNSLAPDELSVASLQSSEFDDLDEMLAEASIPAASLDSAGTDVFNDLEALLGEQTAAAESSQAPVKSAAVDVDVIEDGLGDDLDELLKQADKTMGGPAMATPNQGTARPLFRPRAANMYRGDPTMRVPVKHLDSLSNLVGELVVNRNSLEQDQERLRQFLDNLSHQVLALGDVGARMQDLYERSLLESSLLASRQGYRSPIHSDHFSQPHSSGVEYDPLEMDRFTGFHLLSQEMIELIVRVRESAADIEFLVDETDQVARMLRQITTQLQEGLTRSRMVPFAQTADRLPRAVRDISLKLNKEAELYIEGRETLIDKMILEHLYDPLTHLVNNAITHGIESPEVRKAAKKPAVGRIILRAFHQGNQTVISISDDGAGINPERVRQKAVEQKLITPTEARTLTHVDLYDCLFHPGFSTKDKADDYSGRGVGMDVVRTSLSEMRGSIHIDSALGKGTTFTIRLPLTLSICKALCCLSDRARLAFPMDGVEDMLDVPSERVQTNSEGQTCIQWRDTLLPFQPLSELLTYNRHLSRGTVYGGKREDDMVAIVVLRSAGNFIAIQVDQVLGEQEIVIKQLEGPAPKPVGIAGATVLGDGRIMPIADVLELIDLSQGRIRKDGGVALWAREDTAVQVPEELLEAKVEPMVLIVDDSITVRELLSMTFSKSGYRVEQARDGQEAWEKLRSGLPCDIVFCDIEMPRMDGLELLSRLQKDDTLRRLPIAMLTSRGADRHRQMASQLGARGYFTKPYLEEVLLDAAQRMIKGEVLFSSSSNA